MTTRQAENGSILLEALIAILIFSLGILALVGLQAAAIKNASLAKYRIDASFLANQVVGQMWGDDKTALPTQYVPGNIKYDSWKAQVQAALPGVAAHPPTITFGANNQVTVTIFWQHPSESGPHKFITVAQINGG